MSNSVLATASPLAPQLRHGYTPRRIMSNAYPPRPVEAKPDGLFTPEVGPWAEEKYDLLWHYALMFTRAMRERWHSLRYVDLFSGPGKVRIRGTGRVVYSSPLLALKLPVPFDLAVYCDKKPDCIDSLRRRVEEEAPTTQTQFVLGDANEKVRDVLGLLPPHDRANTALTFCFVDPFGARNLHFATLREIAGQRLVDFLVLLPTGMDTTRNEGLYLRPQDPTIDNLLDALNWRELWTDARRSGKTFDVFIVEQFAQRLVDLGYIYPGIEHTHLVRLPRQHARLYRLILFSRHPLAEKFWRAAMKASTPQQSLDF